MANTLTPWRKKRYALVCSWSLMTSMSSWAGPENGRVVDGQADITQQGNETQINQHSSRVFIEYDGFSIGANESVRFIQPSSQAIAVNRVTGNDLSEILGSLEANGKVFLINPNGVLFGENASINVNGLVVSTLDSVSGLAENGVSLSGATEGIIENRANIHLDDVGGYLALISPTILNRGELSANQVELVSAESVIVQLGEYDLGIELHTASLEGYIGNDGLIEGNLISLRSHIQSQINQTVIANEGEIRATGFELVDGEIHISSLGTGDIVNRGKITTTGTSGGQIQISGDRILHEGDIRADGASGGGEISLEADNLTYLSTDSRISANATESGDGGTVINFSPQYTVFESGATIQARGGALGGNGGFVEVSGIEFVSALGLVDTRAPFGQAGTYYIDPTDIEIGDFSGASGGGSFNIDGEWVPAGDSSQIDASDLELQLGLNNTVLINTNNPLGSGAGNITVTDTIDYDGTGDSTLALTADNAIIFDGGQIVDSTPGGDNLNLDFNATLGDIDLRAGTVIETGAGGRLSLVANSGAIILPDTNLNVVGELVASAQDLRTQTGRTAIISASNTDINLSAPLGDLTINADTASFAADITAPASLTVNFDGQSTVLGSGGISLNNGDLTLAMLGSGHTLDLNNPISVTSGSITSTNAGGALTVNTGLTSNDDQINLSAANGDLTINNALAAANGISASTSNGQLVVSNSLATSSGDITLVAGGQLDLSSSLTADDGNITLLTTSGNLNINGDISATDGTDDGVRAGLIDIAVTDGDLTLLNQSISSTNTVDSDVDGGLGSEPSNQVAIRIRNTSTDGNAYNITLGDNAGDDTLVSAQGGDIYIDARAWAATPGVLTLNSDVTIQSFDTSPASAVAVPVGPNVVDNGATVIAETGRQVFAGEGAGPSPSPSPTPAPPTPTPSPTPTPIPPTPTPTPVPPTPTPTPVPPTPTPTPIPPTPTPTPVPPTPSPSPVPPTPTPTPIPPTPTPSPVPSPTPMPPTPTPAPTPEPTPTPNRDNILDDEITDSIQDDAPDDETGSQAPGDGNPGGSDEPSGIDALFSYDTDNCDSQLDDNEKNRCFKHAEMKKFLNLLFIGGELPEATGD